MRARGKRRLNQATERPMWLPQSRMTGASVSQGNSYSPPSKISWARRSNSGALRYWKVRPSSWVVRVCTERPSVRLLAKLPGARHRARSRRSRRVTGRWVASDRSARAEDFPPPLVDGIALPLQAGRHRLGEGRQRAGGLRLGRSCALLGGLLPGSLLL